MPLEHRFTCPLPNGMHARPAAAFEEQARRFLSEMTLVNERTGAQAGLRSVLALVAADIHFGDPLLLQVTGPDEAEAMLWLQAYVRTELVRSDQPLPASVAAAGAVALPPPLLASRLTWWRGQPVATGVGQGQVVEFGAFMLPSGLLDRGRPDREVERERMEKGLDALALQLEEDLAAAQPGSVAAAVIKAHRGVARDPEFRRSLLERVDNAGDSAATAIAAVETHFAEVLQATGSRILRDRVLDVQDVCSRLLALIYGPQAKPAEVVLSRESVVIADSLTPSQFLALTRDGLLRGLALRRAGATSHVVLLARSFGIPALVDLACPPGVSLDRKTAVVDAELGLLAIDLDAPARRYYAGEVRRLRRREERLADSARRPGLTRDGWRLEVGVNVSAGEEAEAAFKAGAEGVGLFRTEMLFALGETPPSEDEQLGHYGRVVAAAGGRMVTLRTLDAGGDKPLPYLGLPAEPNPFLGRRGVRIYPTCTEMFRAQVRAILRAAAAGPARLLVPMVSSLDELRFVKGVVAQETARLAESGLRYGADLPVGIMVEVPSVAFALDHLAREASFFSIGTNDLSQFFFAADRSNPESAGVADPLHPSFLRLLQGIVEDIHAHDRTVSVCGELAASRRHLPLLVGMGPDAISVAPAAMAEVKAELAGLDAGACRRLLDQAVECATVAEVAERLASFDRQATAPLTTAELVLLDSKSRTKAEAIRELLDQLFVVGRTDAPFALEQAVWERESASSTGVGNGIAVPHCATRHLRTSTIGLLRLAQPVEWGAADDAPVRLVILLAIREAEKDSHLRLLSRLARRLMHEDFRQTLLGENRPEVILEQLRATLAEPG